MIEDKAVPNTLVREIANDLNIKINASANRECGVKEKLDILSAIPNKLKQVQKDFDALLKQEMEIRAENEQIDHKMSLVANAITMKELEWKRKDKLQSSPKKKQNK